MAGARKFKLNLVDRDDIMALTRQAAEISGIAYVMDADKEEIDQILGKKTARRPARRTATRRRGA